MKKAIVAIVLLPCFLLLAPSPARCSPNITDVSPQAGPWNTVVTITGAGFGTVQGGGTVSFDLLDAQVVQLWSDSQIIVEVPPRATPGKVVVSLQSTKLRTFGDQTLTLTQWEDSNGVPFTVTGVALADAIELGEEGWEEETFGNEVVLTDQLGIPWETILAQGENFGLIPADEPEDTPGTLDPLGNLSSGWVGIRKMLDGTGTVRYGTTCVFCHTGTDPLTGAEVEGLPNIQLDLGAMLAFSPSFSPAKKHCLQDWGPGRLDVGVIITGSACNPSNIPPHLYTTGFSRLEFTALAISIDARNAGSANLEAAQRPATPEELEGLAVYGYVLDQLIENPNVDSIAARRGRRVFFDSGCDDCHSPHLGRYSNLDPIPLSVIGTDPDLTTKGVIASGFYRVTPLANLWATPPYFHDGTLATIEEVFDKARLKPGFIATGTPPGADKPGGVRGHEFVFDLKWKDEQRADVVEFLKSVPDTCPGIPDPEQIDSDGDGIGDLCDLCPTRRDQNLVLKRGRLGFFSSGPGGADDTLLLRGSLPASANGALDPLSEDVSVVLADATGTVYTATIPAGTFRAGPSGTSFTFRDPTGAVAGGIRRARLKVRNDGTERWRVKARDVSLQDPGAGLEAVLDIGDDCFTAAARCRQGGSGKRVSCKP